MDEQFVTSSAKAWLKATVAVGDVLLGIDQMNSDRDSARINEHFFVISVGKALEWGEELKEHNAEKYKVFCSFKDALPEAREIRNMREHDIEYHKGSGHKQSKYQKTLTVQQNGLKISVDGSSTIIFDDGYLIGGRLNVQAAISNAKDVLQKI